jgi:carbamoyltransferase
MTHETGLSRLCLAGGVFMNCKANFSISELPEVAELFIHPAASDDGSALGAAYWVARQLGDDPRNPLLHVQHGASFGMSEIKKALDVCNLDYRQLDDPVAITANLLSQGKIIGWFQGGAEMGARALGGRSIIANPNHTDMKDRINARVKFRESWRPYCPSLTQEHAVEYLETPHRNPFMIRADKATALLKEQAPATVHVDNTVRPQIVDKNILPLWHHLIEETGKLTGTPVLLNTSFNVRGEPIVNSPFDAIRTFYSTGLDALVMGEFLILKKDTQND